MEAGFNRHLGQPRVSARPYECLRSAPRSTHRSIAATRSLDNPSAPAAFLLLDQNTCGRADDLRRTSELSADLGTLDASAGPSAAGRRSSGAKIAAIADFLIGSNAAVRTGLLISATLKHAFE